MEEEKAEEKKTKKIERTVWDWERVNTVKPIWMRKLSEVTDDEYDEFYKSITKDYDKPFAHVLILFSTKIITLYLGPFHSRRRSYFQIRFVRTQTITAWRVPILWKIRWKYQSLHITIQLFL